MVCKASKSGVFVKKTNFARFWLLGNGYRMYLLSILLLQNLAGTLFDTIGKIKCPLLYIYCFRFEIILNSSLLRQKCRQRERTWLRCGLQLPSNSTLKMIKRQHLYAIKHKGSFYRCFKFQSRERYINQLSVIFDYPRIYSSL